MPYVTQAELAEIVPYLRTTAAGETSAEIRAALLRLADRYARITTESDDLGQMPRVPDLVA